jgi:hypothetical protein
MAAGDITLLYSSRGTEHNNGVAPREYLTTRLQKVAPRQRALTSGDGSVPRGVRDALGAVPFASPARSSDSTGDWC